ncbi:hypothetical protein HZH66_008131 [Vespula vulgaris]|uniref:Uncharacterized protein n=1 Tax=Vespula vulgaris TaxID=7454 RepID=A0A834JV54_VESVU|nr:hypothetical protein HZH66_008131 [Vespula vulgaris]
MRKTKRANERVELVNSRLPAGFMSFPSHFRDYLRKWNPLIIQNKAEQYHNGWDWTGSDGITSVKIRRDRIELNWTESDRIGLKPIELGPVGSNKIEKSRKR